jgi:calcineurin-like phosphoesterase
MTGPAVSVLGVKPEQSIAMFRGSVRERFAAADGPCKLEGAVFEIDPKTGKCLSVEAIRIED